MPRVRPIKASWVWLAILFVAVPIVLAGVVTPHPRILVAGVIGALVAQVILIVARSRRFAPPSRAVVPGGLDRAQGRQRREPLVPRELPPPPGVLIGREQELEVARTFLVGAGRASVPKTMLILGEAGVGKTALATTLAHLTAGHYPDGQVLIKFDGTKSGADRTQWALEKLVFALKGPKDDDPSPDARRDWYLRRTRGKKILIVLDNVDEAALIENLLPAGSACAVVVTARERPLKLEFGKSVLVPPLTSEHATELLDLLLGGGRVGREREDASRLVLATARVPVAIHMVAAVLAVRRNWTLDVAVRRMDDYLRARGDAGGPPFIGVLGLAHELLTRDERSALAAIGQLHTQWVEPWMLSAFLTAAEPDSPKVSRPAAAGLLDRLSRVRFVDRAVDDQSGLIQYRVREYVTVYAATDLNSRFTPQQVDGGLRAIDAARSRRRERSTEDRLRHTVFRYLDEGRLDEAFGAARECVALAAEQTQVLGPVNARAETDEGLALAALAEVYAELGWIDDGFTFAERSRRRSGASPRTTTRALRIAGSLMLRHHRITDAIDNLQQALDAVGNGDDLERIRVLRELAPALAANGDLTAAEDYAIDAARSCEGTPGSAASQLRASVFLAHAKVRHAASRYDEASSMLSTAEKLTAAADSNLHLWRAWVRLEHARVSLAAGEYDRSRQLGLSALDGFASLSHRYGAGHARLALGRAYLLESNYDKAIPILEESHGTFRRCGDRWIEADAAVTLATAYQHDDHAREAIDLLGSAEQMFLKLGDVDSAYRAGYLLWTVESSHRADRLRFLPTGVKGDAGRTRRDTVPAVSRSVKWPAP